MPNFESIIDKLFDTNKSFNRDDFLEFVGELTGKYPNNIKKSQDKEGLHILDIYEDNNNEKMAIIIYKMPNASKVEKARNEQRNLISSYLKNEGVYSSVNNVLVAFYSDDNPDWRLSFIKQEFKLENGKILNELTPAKRYSFLVEFHSKNLTIKQRLNNLLSGNKSINDIEDAFSVEKVSKDFFNKYVMLYKELVEAFNNDNIFNKLVIEKSNGDQKFKYNFAKKLLGQLVFLFFIQKKGWLGVDKNKNWGEGNKRFLQDLLDECINGGDPKKELNGMNFFNDYLEHLFYDNLNKKREDDFSEYFNCKIPYLNGGLFEPMNGYKWLGFDNILLIGENNNQIFKRIFDTFDEYNFTVYENDPLEQDVAIDPEMLGKVFENLLDIDERKSKGAFYTPREIVHYMCRESLKNHIINKTGISEDRINKLFEKKDSMLNLEMFKSKMSATERYDQFKEFIDYANNIVDCIKTVKIVDPAVGSGAFPMGLLKEIVSLRRYIQETILLETNVSEYQIKKETLENCIYGVDLDPGAVEIAKLRFWLSLVIEEEATDTIEPLPNLDYKIMQGNSLIEDIIVGDRIIKIDLENNTKKLTKEQKNSFSKKEERELGNANQESLGFTLSDGENELKYILQKLKSLHSNFFKETNAVKKQILKNDIDGIEKKLIRISGEVEVNKLQSQIENISGKYILSGMPWDENDAKKVAYFMAQISSIKEMEKKYEKDNIRSFFPWKLHFGEVFNDNGGFDIVIGNPPYGANIDKFINLFAKIFPETSKGFKDIYKFFYDLGINKLSNNGGILSYITPNTVLLQPRYEDLRKLLLKKSILQVLNLGDGVFENVVAPTCIIILSKTIVLKELKYFEMSKNGKFTGLDFSNFLIIEQEIFNNNKTSLFVVSYANNDKSIQPLKNVLVCKDGGIKYQRVNVGLAEKGRNDLAQRLFYENNRLNESDIKFYIGKDINKDGYHINLYSNRYMRANYQEILKNNERIYWNKELIGIKEKLIWRQTSSFFIGTYIDKPIYFANTIQSGYVIEKMKGIFNIKYILSLLNSTYLRYVYGKYVQEGGRVFPQVKLSKLENLPIKQISPEKQKPFIDLVDQILEITKKEDYLEREDLKKQVKILENKIDKMVYELYELTHEEIELVEESLRK